MTRLLIVGEAPSRTSDPARPLSGEPLRSRLIGMLGVEDDVYDAVHGRIIKMNLLDEYPGVGRFRLTPQGRRVVAFVRARAIEDGARVLLLGRNVARAFSMRPPRRPYCRWFIDFAVVAILPHPSGRNHWWNDADNKRRAFRFMRELGRRLT